jgi:hypothetical protein
MDGGSKLILRVNLTFDDIDPGDEAICDGQ